MYDALRSSGVGETAACNVVKHTMKKKIEQKQVECTPRRPPIPSPPPSAVAIKIVATYIRVHTQNFCSPCISMYRVSATAQLVKHIHNQPQQQPLFSSMYHICSHWPFDLLK